MKVSLAAILMIGAMVVALPLHKGLAQDEGGEAAPAPAADAGAETSAGGGGAAEAASSGSGGGGFFNVIAKSGFMGIVLWLTILGASVACVYFIVDCGITVRGSRIMPQQLIDNVTEAMEQGDVLKALDSCEQDPGPMANILSAGFSQVEEGFEVIQDAITTAAELESEYLVQKITYLSVVGSLSPMLGLLGTVQGMIKAFASLAFETGAGKTAALALNISQALYTTAAGLSVAVPAVACYYIFRNKANRIILQMEGITIDLIKDLRNVEVVEDE
ncbi:MAG: MotA/TolQ/ExbB proton channel family protein [Verrucomicrobia bacterium]|nr:MotA/TolQ/ExbB proton channel family protein [Verrucomicrobiota bacterium]MDA1088119.1 MotA/TolQ/ExbB proton channel family protein [Verrucomicrobiota bacterium]